MICPSFDFFAAFGATWLLYHILNRLSRGFWKVFSKIFAVFLLVRQPVVRAAVRQPLFDSLHIIALLFPFVNRFFESFLSLETIAVCHKYVVAKLCIITNICRGRVRKPLSRRRRIHIIKNKPPSKKKTAKNPANTANTGSWGNVILSIYARCGCFFW